MNEAHPATAGTSLAGTKKFCYADRGSRCSVPLDGAIAHVAPGFCRDRIGDDLRRRRVEVHAAPGSVSIQAVPYVEVLLEGGGVAEVEERSLVRGRLHRGREVSLHQREVTRREVVAEVVDVGPHLETFALRQGHRIDPRIGDEDHP